MSYELHLTAFDGPFDLLLYLIKKNEIDIYDIPVAEITDQYLAYLRAMEEFDLEIASSFLIMAANLLSLKARMLLPKPLANEEEPNLEDIRSELVSDLLEYMAYKEAAGLLEKISREESQYLVRPNDEELYLQLFAPVNPLEGKTISDLTEAFRRVLKQVEDRGQVITIAKEEITVKDKLTYIKNLIKENAGGISFNKIFYSCRSKIEIVVTFLALLELVRQAAIRTAQGDAFEDIYIYPAKPLL